MHFQMSKPPFQGAVHLLEKSLCLHDICSIIDIEHPFQKCNMFETVSTMKECSFATEYMAKTSSCEEATFLENWIIFVCVYSSPWVRSAQPSFRQLEHLKKYVQDNPTIMFLKMIKYLTHMKGALHKFNNRFFKDDHTLSKECYMHTICSNNV